MKGSLLATLLRLGGFAGQARKSVTSRGNLVTLLRLSGYAGQAGETLRRARDSSFAQGGQTAKLGLDIRLLSRQPGRLPCVVDWVRPVNRPCEAGSVARLSCVAYWRSGIVEVVRVGDDGRAMNGAMLSFMDLRQARPL